MATMNGNNTYIYSINTNIYTIIYTWENNTKAGAIFSSQEEDSTDGIDKNFYSILKGLDN